MKLDKDDLTLIMEQTRQCEKLFNKSGCSAEIIAQMVAIDSVNFDMLPRSMANTLSQTTDYFVILTYYVFPNDYKDDPIGEVFDTGLTHVDLAIRLMSNRTTGNGKLTALNLINEKIDKGACVPEETAVTLFAFEHALDRILRGATK